MVWYAREAGRIGEVALIPLDGSQHVLGRGDGEDSGGKRVRFVRQRPHGTEPTIPLEAPTISRKQLRISALDGALSVQQLGRGEVRVNGAACERGVARDGDILSIRGELSLYVAIRPAEMPVTRYFPADAMGTFGEADRLGIIGESSACWRARDYIAFAAKADLHTLITGKSGTGKELAARGIHALSTRADRPFVSRNAATLPVGLVEAELFGNIKNYPNPGTPERLGLIGQAQGGTLFLDEIGELPHELQARLLRVLDSDGEYQRLGESISRRSDFRLIGATNRDITSLKHDVLARFPIGVALPSLAQRREDIPLLARGIALRAAGQKPELWGRFIAQDAAGNPFVRLSQALVEHAVRANWEGNVRELAALIWRSVASSFEDTLELPHDAIELRPVAPNEDEP